MINKLKVYSIQFKKLGLATFWGGIATFRRLLLSGGVATFKGVTTFGWLLLLGCTSSHKKTDINFRGGTTLGGVATFRGVAAFRRVNTFGGLLLLGCTSGHKKLTLIPGGATFGGSLLAELYGNIYWPL